MFLGTLQSQGKPESSQVRRRLTPSLTARVGNGSVLCEALAPEERLVMEASQTSQQRPGLRPPEGAEPGQDGLLPAAPPAPWPPTGKIKFRRGTAGAGRSLVGSQLSDSNLPRGA